MQILYVSLIPEILYLSSTNRSYLMTLCKKKIQIWPEHAKIHFIRIKKAQLIKPIKKVVSLIIPEVYLELCQIPFNPFVPNAPFLLPLKTSENLTVF